MDLSTPLFVNPNAALRQGFDDESKRREESRLQKRKALQELADQAASEGRELSMDEWFRMAQDSIGPTAVLYGDAPTSSMLEGIRANANAKAQEVAQKRKFDEAQRGFQLEDQVKSRVSEMSRTGASETDIYDTLRDTYGDEMAKRFKPRLSAYMSTASLEDEKLGNQLGGAFQTTEEADEYIKARPGLNASVQQGVRNATKINEQRNDATISQIANALANNGGYADDASARSWVMQSLPPAMRQSPKAQEYVERVMGAAKGASGIVGRQTDYGVQTAARTGVAQNAFRFAETDARLKAEADTRLQERIQSATTETQQAILKQREAATAAFKGLAGTKDKTLLSMASQSAAFLDSYVVPPAQRDAIFAAVEAKDPKALAAAMKSAELMSVNAEAMRNARVAEARIAAGKLEGTPEQMYQTASTISEQEDRRVMAKRGEAIREALRRPATAMDARRMIADTARIVAGSVHGTADLLAQSGVFQANQEQMAGFANQAIERMLAPLAATSGVPIEELRDEVYAQLNQRPAQAIERRPTASDYYRQNQGGLMTGAGISGYPPGGYQAPRGYAPEMRPPMYQAGGYQTGGGMGLNDPF